MSCKCEHLFRDFTWSKLDSLARKDVDKDIGIYAIKYRAKGLGIKQTIKKTKDFFNQAQWDSSHSYIFNRIDRIEDIRDCPVIYLGSAPSVKSDGLRSRYTDLCGRRHTIFYSILALLVAGWDLQWGFLKTENPREMEKEIAYNYLEIHDRYPALVRRI